MKMIFAAAAVLALAAPAFAQAPPAGMTPESGFAQSDTNKDGVVTKDESGAWPAGVFERADANKDGKVTFDEMKADWTANVK